MEADPFDRVVRAVDAAGQTEPVITMRSHVTIAGYLLRAVAPAVCVTVFGLLASTVSANPVPALDKRDLRPSTVAVEPDPTHLPRDDGETTSARSGNAPTAARTSNAAAGTVQDPRQVPACASDPDLIGLSRIVEIDTTGGPHFGGQFGDSHPFLDDGEVVLTFDDGPMRSQTRHVLEALADNCTRGTFFMVGRMAVADPAMVREVAAQGHTVAMHTWSHKNLRAISLARAKQEFEMGVSAVARAGGTAASPFFRFPYLSESRAMADYLADRGVASVGVDIDSKDYFSRNAQPAIQRVMAQLAVKRKGIILMHDIQPATVKGIRMLLKELHERHYKVVHIVAKESVETVAEYDQAIEKAFLAKSKSRKHNPLADRSVVWSIPAEDADGAAAPTGTQDKSHRGAGSTAPAQKRNPGASKPEQIAPHDSHDLPWQMRLFPH